MLTKKKVILKKLKGGMFDQKSNGDDLHPITRIRFSRKFQDRTFVSYFSPLIWTHVSDLPKAQRREASAEKCGLMRRRGEFLLPGTEEYDTFRQPWNKDFAHRMPR